MTSSASPRAMALARLADLAVPGVRLGNVPEAPPRLGCGVPAVDGLLEGGWPRGRIGELYGPVSSGKTALALACMAAATQRGEVVACIDTPDAFHPLSAADAGADLGRILWVRPPSAADALRCADLLLRAGGFSLVLLDLGQAPGRPTRGPAWPRLRQAAEKSGTALLVLAAQPVAGSFAALGLRVEPRQVLWTSSRGSTVQEEPGRWSAGRAAARHPSVMLFDGYHCRTILERNKMGRPARHAEVGIRVPDAVGGKP